MLYNFLLSFSPTSISLFVTKKLGELHATCVFESEFGFIINCNFKKSSLFRVRNLGGVKAHLGLGNQFSPIKQYIVVIDWPGSFAIRKISFALEMLQIYPFECVTVFYFSAHNDFMVRTNIL